MACLVAGQPTASQLLLQPVTPNSLNLWDSNEVIHTLLSGDQTSEFQSLSFRRFLHSSIKSDKAQKPKPPKVSSWAMPLLVVSIGFSVPTLSLNSDGVSEEIKPGS